MKLLLPGAASAVISTGLALLALDVGAQQPVTERNYAGEPCVYFYRPVERGSDGQMRVNEYAEGTAVCHGSRMYRCEQRSWQLLGGCSAYDPGFVAAARSEVLEGYLNRGPPASPGAALAPAAPPAQAAAAVPAAPGTEGSPAATATPAASLAAAPAAAMVPESPQLTAAEPIPEPASPPVAAATTAPESAPLPAAAAPAAAAGTTGSESTQTSSEIATSAASPAAPQDPVPAPVAAVSSAAPDPLAAPAPSASASASASAEPAPRPAAVSAVLSPSCLSSFIPGIDRLAQHDYRQFVVGAGLRGQEPEVLSRMALRAAAQGEYFKALYLSRIALDYDQFSVDLWESHAAFAEQVQLSGEVQQARANARARRQSDMIALTPTLDYGMALPSLPATLADWAALFSLLADDTASRADHGDSLAVTQFNRLAPISLQDAWAQTVGLHDTQDGVPAAMAGLPSPVLWASGRSRGAFVTAQVRQPGGTTRPARRTTLGQQAAGQSPTQGPLALAGRAFAVPRLATICAADGESCTPALLPLEVMLSDDDFADVGITALPPSRTALAQLVAELSARGAAGESLILMPGNTGDPAAPTSIVAVDAEGACIAFEPGPDAWLAPAR